MLFNETDTEETFETEETEDTDTTEDAEETEEKVEKPKETLEQREARLARQLEQTRKKLGKDTEVEKKSSTSNEPDYAKLGFLEAKGVQHPDDQKVVMDEAHRLKLPLTDVLQMEHIKSRLASNNDARVSQDGMPKGQGRKGGTSKGDVDYYLAHPDEVPPDLDLHNKVIDARLKKETNSNMFSSVPFTG